MKKITLLTLMSIVFTSLIHAQVDKLLPPGSGIKSNLPVSEIKKQINNNLNEKKSNFHTPLITKVSPSLALSVTKSIPSSKSSSKKIHNNIPSTIEGRNRFLKKRRRSRSSNISRSNSNTTSSRIMDISIDVIAKLNPYAQIFNNDLITFDEVESVGEYIEKYTYNAAGSLTTEIYYDDYDASTGLYSATAGYQYTYNYDNDGNIEQINEYTADFINDSWVLTNAVTYTYENDLPTFKTYFIYDSTADSFNYEFQDEYVYNDDNLIELVYERYISEDDTSWLPAYAESYLYVNGMIDETYYYNWSSETTSYEYSERDWHYFNSAGQYIQLVYFQYDIPSDDFVSLGYEDYTYHSGELQENVISSYRDYYASDDGSQWVADESYFIPTIYRGYGIITTVGDVGSHDSSGVYIEDNDFGIFYSYSPPETITPSYTETFDTFLPEAWEVAQGDYGSPTGVSTRFISWDFGNNSNSPNGKSAVINIWGSSVADYLFSPVFNLLAGTYFLNYDVALTDYDTTNSSTLGADDYVALLVTQNRGDSWVELYRWGANTEISNEGQSATEISLTGYGTEVQFAFYVNSGVNDSEDTEFFIDNFQITSESLSTSTNTLEGFTLYPTIVKEALNFRSQNKVEAITVFNLLGQKVFSGALDTNNSSINLSKLRPGVYVVKVSVEGKIGSYKIIKE